MPSESMEPAYSAEEVVTVDLDAYDSAKPAVGDLKRIVATPGDRLSIRKGQPVLNGSVVLADPIQVCRHSGCNMKRTIAILPGHYFVMGDNSRASSDSRFWGPVPARAIIGKVVDEAEPRSR